MNSLSHLVCFWVFICCSYPVEKTLRQCTHNFASSCTWQLWQKMFVDFALQRRSSTNEQKQLIMRSILRRKSWRFEL
jgi:myosin-crossreactive antigen